MADEHKISTIKRNTVIFIICSVIALVIGCVFLSKSNPCNDYAATQAFLQFLGRPNDANVKHTVKYVQKADNVTGIYTGWIHEYYGAPVCYIKTKSISFFAFFNPAEQVWEEVYNCRKSKDGFDCGYKKIDVQPNYRFIDFN